MVNVMLEISTKSDIIIYIYNNNNNNNNNKIRFGNCLGEGRSRAYQVFHPFMITRRKNYIGI